MKIHAILLATGVALALSACKKESCGFGEVPECIMDRIENNDNELFCDDANVKAYTFQQKTVYVFDAGTCGADFSYPVLDADCNTLGFLGGFQGNTKINGEEFSNAVFVRTVWEK